MVCSHCRNIICMLCVMYGHLYFIHRREDTTILKCGRFAGWLRNAMRHFRLEMREQVFKWFFTDRVYIIKCNKESTV